MHSLISDHTQVWMHHMDIPGGGGVFGTVPETSCHRLVQFDDVVDSCLGVKLKGHVAEQSHS